MCAKLQLNRFTVENSMERTNNLYIVIQFLEFPYKDIDEYVCVPSSWIIHRRKTDKRVVVSYPHNENPSDTAKRVKKRENFSKDWNLFMAFVTQGTDSYDDAKNVIKERKKKKEKMDNVHYKYRSLHKKKRDQESMVEKKTRRPKQNAKLNREIDKPLDLVVTSKNDHKSATKRPERTALPNPPTDAALKRSKAVEPAESISEVVEQPCETFECSNENQSSPTHEDFSIQNSCTSEIPVEKSDDRSSLKETEHVENSTQTNLTFDPSKIIVNTAFFEDFLSVLRGAHTTSVNSHSLINMLIKKLIDNTETLREVKNFVIGIRSSISDIPTASSSTNTGAEIEKISKKDKNKRKQQDVEYDDDDDDDDEEIPKKKRCHKRKFVLPPEYDKNDSKWTLKYRECAPGLVELMPYTSVYVNSVNLRNCKRLSKDCKSLARMLLVEIFTQNALSICSLTGSRARAYDVEGAVIRPGLDENARTVLLTFVEEYGREKGWITLDTQSIQNSLRNKMQEMRSKYG